MLLVIMLDIGIGSSALEKPFIVPWCKSSTTGFGPVREGAKPSGTTNFKILKYGIYNRRRL